MDGEFGYRPRRGEGEGAFPEDPSPERLTELIREASQGRSEALERLFRRIVPELKELARTQLARESGVPDLRPTALINEMFLRLFRSPPQFADSDHFFRIVSRTMGRILIDRAKAAKRLKRGAGRRPRALTEADHPIDDAEFLEWLIVRDLLSTMSIQHPRPALVFEFHHLVGLTFEEIAALLDQSTKSIRDLWCFAQAWLSHRFELDRP